MNLLLLFFILYIILILISSKRYISILPTIPVYPNSEKEALLVKEQINIRNKNDVEFFKLTDPSVSHAFSHILPENITDIDNIITQTHVSFPILFCKYLINRPRPYQLLTSLDILHSNTGNTPAYPSGHAYQAYYLAHYFGKKYPELQYQLDSIAERCDSVRVKAGIHYPSDGIFSKQLVNFLYK